MNSTLEHDMQFPTLHAGSLSGIFIALIIFLTPKLLLFTVKTGQAYPPRFY